MTIEDFLRLLLRNALLLVAALVLGAGLGYGFSYTQAPVYQATALGFVRGASGAGSAPAGTDTSSVQYAKAQFYLPLFGTRAVGQRIVDELSLPADPDELAGSLQAELDPNAAIITVTASADTPQHASDIADAAIGAVAAEADTLEPGTGDQLVAYQTSLVPGAPVSPDRSRYAAIGAGIGLLLGLALAWLRDRNDSRIRTVEDIRTAVAVPALGVLPEAKDLGRDARSLLHDPTHFQTREALRKLRTNLRYADVDSPPRSIVVTSSAPGEGKSTVAANLGRVLARAGQRTLLIDADLRRPVEAEQFGLDGAVGLSQVLAGSVQLSEVLQKDPKSRLMVLPAGEVPPNPSELLGSRRMHELVATLTPEFFVIIDAPPVLAVTDAQLLARHTDGAILVAVPGRTRVEGVTRAVESIRAVGGAVFGVVMNRASSNRLTRLAYGDAEYGYSAYGYSSRDGGYGYASTPGDGSEADIDDLVPAPVAPASGTAGVHTAASGVPDRCAPETDDAGHRGRRAAARHADPDPAP